MILQRQPNCSLLYSAFTYTLNNTTASVTVDSQLPNFEKTLHDNSFLTTTPGKFVGGCTDSSQATGPRYAINLGLGKDGNILGVTFAGGSGGILTSGLKSDGTLTSPVELATDNGTNSMMSGDLNNDGNQDVVTINGDGLSSSVDVFLGKDDGSLQPETTYPLPNAIANYGALDTMDSDSTLDLVVGVGSAGTFQFFIFPGKGDGTFNTPNTFTPPANSVSFNDLFITADLNGDGHKDILTSRGQLFLGAGDGKTFTAKGQVIAPPQNPSSFYAPGMVAADFNHDGKLDLATDDGITIRIFLGNGDGTFTVGAAYAAIPNTGLLVATDLDGDGNLDLFSGLGNSGAYGGDNFLPSQAYALLGNGDGTFQGAPSLPINYTGTNIADLNGDGRMDIVGIETAFPQTTLTTFLAQSNGVLKSGAQLVVPSNQGVDSVALGDFDGDKVPDVIFLTTLNGTQGLYLALGSGDGSFGTPTLIPTPSLTTPPGFDNDLVLTGLRVGDFNHDGKLDIIYNFSDEDFSKNLNLVGFAVQLGDGKGNFAAPVVTTTYSSVTPPLFAFSNTLSAVADVNKDNFPDVFLVAPSTIMDATAQAQVQLFLANGDGSFKAPAILTLTDNIRPPFPDGSLGSPLAIADLNGDGNLDIVASGSSTDGTEPEVAIALGNGDGRFKAPTILKLEGFGFAGSPAIADFDGDGKLDLDVQGIIEGSGQGIFPGKGDGTFTTIANTDGTVSAPEEIFLAITGGAAAADFNGDGKPDLIVGGVELLNKSGATPPALATTATVVTATPNPSTLLQSVTFSATVTSATAGAITGTVAFFDGANQLGTGAVGAAGLATFPYNFLATGAHSITAQYGGDATYAASTSPVFTQTVNPAAVKSSTSTALVSSPNPAAVGANVTFTATVSSATAGTISGTVTFFDGVTSLGPGTIAAGVASLATTTLAAGSHSITAQYGGDANYAASTSTAVTQVVNAAPDFTISASPSMLTIPAGQSGTVAITVTPLNGSTQTLNFSCAPLPAASSCAFSPLPPITLDGTHPVTLQLTVSTTARTTKGSLPQFFSPPDRRIPSPRIPAQTLAMLCLLALLAAYKMRWRTSAVRVACMLILIIVPVGLLSSCSGSKPLVTGTPAGTTQVSVTASATSGSHSASLTLVVQ